MKTGEERSRLYEYGAGKEYLTREEAMSQAIYKRAAMIDVIGEKRQNGEAKIEDTGSSLQVIIPIKWESR